MGCIAKKFNKSSLKSAKELAGKLAEASVSLFLTNAGIDSLYSTYGGQAAGSFVSLLFDFSDEIDERNLSTLENSRVSAELLIICGVVKSKLDSGKHLRNDDFFSALENDRSAADEIVEGILNAAQFEHEQKKLIYYANLVANIAFDDTISRANADFLIKIAKNLSYRQLCLIYLLYNNPQYPINENAARKSNVYQEIFDLYMYGICYRKHIDNGEGGVFQVREKGNDTITITPIYSYMDVIFDEMYLDVFGEKIFELMELSTLSIDEISAAITLDN